jgi:hypothetical protein
MSKNLNYFIGRVCTIFTQPINRNFKEENPQTFIEQPFHYFVGVIEEIDNEGILVTQIMSGFKSYFFKAHIISIAEEEVLHPENKADAEIIEKLKSANSEVRDKMKEYETKNESLVNPDEMMSVLKNIQGK